MPPAGQMSVPYISLKFAGGEVQFHYAADSARLESHFDVGQRAFPLADARLFHLLETVEVVAGIADEQRLEIRAALEHAERRSRFPTFRGAQ